MMVTNNRVIGVMAECSSSSSNGMKICAPGGSYDISNGGTSVLRSPVSQHITMPTTTTPKQVSTIDGEATTITTESKRDPSSTTTTTILTPLYTVDNDESKTSSIGSPESVFLVSDTKGREDFGKVDDDGYETRNGDNREDDGDSIITNIEGEGTPVIRTGSNIYDNDNIDGTVADIDLVASMASSENSKEVDENLDTITSNYNDGTYDTDSSNSENEVEKQVEQEQERGSEQDSTGSQQQQQEEEEEQDSTGSQQQQQEEEEEQDSTGSQQQQQEEEEEQDSTGSQQQQQEEEEEQDSTGSQQQQQEEEEEQDSTGSQQQQQEEEEEQDSTGSDTE